LSPASLITVTITHVVAVTVTIALVAVNRLAPLLPSLLPPKPSLSSSHSTLVANAIACFITRALFVTRHPFPHRHHLAALTLFSHMLLSLVDCFVFTFNVDWAVSQQVSQNAMI
jgi:hypothetical protein